MTHIRINEHLFSSKFDKSSTILSFLDYVTNENINTSGHIVVGLSIDNNPVNVDSNDPSLSRPLSNIDSLEIITKNSLQLSYEAIESIPLYIDDITHQIILTTELLRNGENEEGNLKFADTIDTIQLFIQLVTGIQNSLTRNMENFKKPELIEQIELKLLDIVKDVIEARELSDVTLLCDLLEYELVANLNQWKEKVVPQLLEKRI